MSAINLSDAKAMTQNWRSVNQNQSFNGHAANEIFPNAYHVDIADLQAIMNTPGVQGMRIYFGFDTNNPSPDPTGNTFPMKTMIVATDANGNDIIATTDPCGVYDYGLPCPDKCDTNSPLMV